MSSILHLTLLLWIFASSLGAHAGPPILKPKDEKTIHWLVHDLPPFLELKEAGQGMEIDITKATGPLATVQRNFEKGMPNYKHRYFRIPFVRAQSLLSENNQLCSALLQASPEREEVMIFGDEITIFPPVGLITRKKLETHKLVMQGDLVDMQKTLQTGKFRLGTVKGRFYTKALVPVLENNKGYTLVTDGIGRNLFDMLENDRIDGVLGYYLELTGFEKDRPEFKDLQFSRLKEAQEFPTLQVSCEKSAWGQKTLKDIGLAMEKQKTRETAHQFFLSALGPERRAEYQRLYDQRPKIKK